MRRVDDDTVLACAQKLIDNNIFSVIVTGGEPLVKKELTKKVIRLLRENQTRVSLNSNITLLDDDFIIFLKEQKVGVLTSCPSGIANSFSRLVGVDNYTVFEDKIKKLVAAGVHFSVNMVVTKENLHEVRTTAEKMHALGCKSFAATPMGLNVEYPRVDLLLTVEEVRRVIADLLWVEATLKMEVDILEVLPKCIFPEYVLKGKHHFLDRKCTAGRSVIAVSCNGDVRPCPHNPYPYGNILREELRNIWDKMSDWRSTRYIPKECQGCTWLNRCNGGCRTSAKVINGDWDKKDMWCTGRLTTPILNNEKKTIYLTPESRLQINKNYKIRQEGDGAFLIYNMTDDIFFMVNNAFYEFINSLHKKSEFFFGELINEQNMFQIQDACLFLINKKILELL